MWQTGYPLHVTHGYVIPTAEAREFAGLVHRVKPETLSQIEVVDGERRPLLAYAGLVLEHLIAIARPKEVVISALGVREGLLYSRLRAHERRTDPLLAAAHELGVLPKTPMLVERGRLVLRFRNGLQALAGERVFNRLRQLARLIGRESAMETE